MVATVNRMGRPKKAEPSEQIRVPQSLAKRLRRLAAHLGVDVGDFVADAIGPALDLAEAKMVKEIEKEREDNAEGE